MKMEKQSSVGETDTPQMELPRKELNILQKKRKNEKNRFGCTAFQTKITI